MTAGFALWITGLPASGKSSVTAELVVRLRERDVPVVVLESDEMRTILTPEATYSDEEREHFYEQLARVGEIIARNGVNVIFDATGNRRSYRDRARRLFDRFVEVYLECPVEICVSRDPKGIYARASKSEVNAVPGLQGAYEEPLMPDLRLSCRSDSALNAAAIAEKLKQLAYI